MRIKPHSVFNLSIALLRLEGDTQLLHDLADFYVQDVPPLLEVIETAIEHGKIDEAVWGARSIKGLSATFDASEACSAAEAVENAGLSGDLATMRQRLTELRRTIDVVISELQAEVLSVA